MEKNERKRKHTLFFNLIYIIKHIWLWDKNLFIHCFFYTILKSAYPFIAILLPKIIIDEIMGQKRPDYIIAILAAASVLSLVIFVLWTHLDDSTWYRHINIRCKFMLQQGRKVMGMPFEMTESPKVLDRFEKAKVAVGDRISSDNRGIEGITDRLLNIPSQLVTFLGYIGIVISLSPIVLIFLILTIALNYFLNLKTVKYEYGMNEQSVPLYRQIRYYDERIFDLKFGKDIRIFDIGKLLSSKLIDAVNRKNQLFKKTVLYNFSYGSIGYLIEFIRIAVTYGFLTYSVIFNGMGIGDFTMFTATVFAFSGSMQGIIRTFSDIIHKNMYMNDFLEFMKIESTKKSQFRGRKISELSRYSFEFENVSFKFPGSEAYVFKDFSLKMNHGEKLALVGINGAGKTTLIKLLTMLYQPDSGRILLNGVNIMEYEKEEYFKLFSIVFQEINIFAFTIAENVALKPDSGIDRKAVMECIQRVGLSQRINTLEDGIDTQMQKILHEKGIEFSGGEAQKLAIARALFKNAPVVILDEPTSALDPIAENNIYENINKLVGNKNAIFVSHRLSSTRFCDRVVLLHNGKLMEDGTHEELMKKNGRYARMFEMQASYYNDLGENDKISMKSTGE